MAFPIQRLPSNFLCAPEASSPGKSLQREVVGDVHTREQQCCPQLLASAMLTSLLALFGEVQDWNTPVPG